jgi:hypothetical protein
VGKPSDRDLRRYDPNRFPGSLYHPVAFPTGLTIKKRLGNTNLFIHPRLRRHRQPLVERSSWQSALDLNVRAVDHIGVLLHILRVTIL